MTDAKAAPKPEEIELPSTVVAHLVALDVRVQMATTAVDQYQAGLCAGLGVAVERVVGIDADRNVLILRPE